jgi:glutathione synthase
MNILFVADPLDTFKIQKDTTFAMMRECARQGLGVYACELGDLFWRSGDLVKAQASRVNLNLRAGEQWFSKEDSQACALREFSAVLMRKDPPFDVEYFYATHLLEHAKREGARVFNDPAALRDHPEKLAILNVPHLISPTLVTKSAQQIKAFHQEHQDIILKPLDGMGGKGIYRVKSDGLNLGSLIETLNKEGEQTVMVQRYIPEIKNGDKRILLINGQAVPYCLARIPQGNEVRGNLAAGGLGLAQALTQRDLEIANELGPILQSKGLFLVGLDVIGDLLTEINVTSPTCFQEITDQTGFDVAAFFVNELKAQL